ncbi:hypothetical protein EVAR_27896_1 [Eumeta japonica]|uniref:Uncharacterized protein n=1 Tax=Eumeta variegata TaxID=151549 RepID=A0A4C1UWX4_EUMVA|nr:hypothetical protein EVAR_27896_1 [Eumeta japonica]
MEGEECGVGQRNSHSLDETVKASRRYSARMCYFTGQPAHFCAAVTLATEWLHHDILTSASLNGSEKPLNLIPAGQLHRFGHQKYHQHHHNDWRPNASWAIFYHIDKAPVTPLRLQVFMGCGDRLLFNFPRARLSLLNPIKIDYHTGYELTTFRSEGNDHGRSAGAALRLCCILLKRQLKSGGNWREIECADTADIGYAASPCAGNSTDSLSYKKTAHHF